MTNSGDSKTTSGSVSATSIIQKYSSLKGTRSLANPKAAVIDPA